MCYTHSRLFDFNTQTMNAADGQQLAHRETETASLKESTFILIVYRSCLSPYSLA